MMIFCGDVKGWIFYYDAENNFFVFVTEDFVLHAFFCSSIFFHSTFCIYEELMLRVLPECWNPADSWGKNSWVQHTLRLCFYSSLFLSRSPPTVVFAPIVTTQQPALASSDWWISCDGGGLSERFICFEAALISNPHLVYRRGASRSCLCASCNYCKSKKNLFVDVQFVISYKNHKTRTCQGLKYSQKSLFFVIFSLVSFFLLFVFDQ